jgi:hypothetical protein
MSTTVIQSNIGNTPIFHPTKDLLETLSPYVRITDTDTDTGLTNYCYINEPVRDEQFEKNKDIIKKCRGLVLDTNGDVVLSACTYTPEYSSADTDMISEFVNIGGGVSSEEGENNIPAITRGFSDCSFYESHEGALIRLFNYNGKWFMSTHRKLNAFKSRWSGTQSYGTSFKNALKYQIDTNSVLRDSMNASESGFLQSFQDTLDPSKKYMFLVKNVSENRLVCKPTDTPTMYHVSTILEDGTLDLDDNINIQKPKKFEFNSIDDLYIYVNNCDASVTPGVIVFGPENKQFKVSSPNYIYFSDVRGNQPSVKFRYLEIRCESDKNKSLRDMYPDYVDKFDEYESIIETIASNIHTAYMDRFINRKHVKVPPAEYQVIKIAHGWYIEDRSTRRVTKRVICDILNTQKPSSINQMIKHILYPRPDLKKPDVSGIDNIMDSIKLEDVEMDERAD